MKVMQVMEVMEVTKAKPLRSLSVRPEFIEGFLSLSEKSVSTGLNANGKENKKQLGSVRVNSAYITYITCITFITPALEPTHLLLSPAARPLFLTTPCSSHAAHCSHRSDSRRLS